MKQNSGNELDLVNSYDRFAEWLQILKPVYYDPERTSRLASFIKRLKPNAQTILDCACGIGSAAIDLVNNGFQLTCSDVSPEMLNLARQNARAADITQMSFYETDWRELEENIPRKFDCIMNCGVNIYHLRGKEQVRALQSMKNLLKPGGLLLVDNKNWQQIVFINEGVKEVRLVEKRPIIRAYSSRPLQSKDRDSSYFFDIAWAEADQWIIEVVRLPSSKTDLFSGEKNTLLKTQHHSVHFQSQHDGLQVQYCRQTGIPSSDATLCDSIVFTGYPIESSCLAKSMAEIGLERVSISDKEEALYHRLDNARTGLYDLITAFNPG